MRPIAWSVAALSMLSWLLLGLAEPASALTWYGKLCTGFTACNNVGMGNAGYQNEYGISHWGMDGGHNCTNYAAYRLMSRGIEASYLRGQGNAYQWGGVAAAHGVAVDGQPRLGDIAWFSSGSGVGSYGHVAYVEAVSGGRVTVSEDNWGGDFDWRQYNISDVSGFIHFGGSSPQATGAGTTIQNVASGRCVDVAGGSTAPGAAVQLYDCNGSPAQGWRFVGDSLRVYASPEQCLDVTGGNMVQGTVVQLWGCGSGNGAQMWSVRTDGTIRTVNGLCLDAQNGGAANGTRLQVWQCNGSAAQIWAGPAFDNGGAPLSNPSSGRCVDAAGGSAALGTVTQLHDCNGTAAQRWVRDGQALRLYGNECLDVVGAQLQSGQPVQLWGCGLGNQAQMWSVRADGTIRTVNGLCLDAVNGGTANGTRLQIWQCNGSGAQRWAGLAADVVPGPQPPAGGGVPAGAPSVQPPASAGGASSQPASGSADTSSPLPSQAASPVTVDQSQAVGQAVRPPEVAPAAIGAATVTYPAKRTAVVSWVGAASATSYRVRLSKKNSAKKWSPWTSRSETSVRVSKLQKRATYRVQITPVGPGGVGATTTFKFKQRK